MINNTVLNELQNDGIYQTFKRNRAIKVFLPTIFALVFLIIMLTGLDTSDVSSIIVCLFMFLAVLGTGGYGLYVISTKTTLVDKGIVKDRQTYTIKSRTSKDSSTGTEYIVSVGDRLYRAVPAEISSENARIYQSGDEVRIIIFGKDKMGYMFANPREEN